jgi:predicted AlkP superfamily pyrophosphatase or phosphodiesterase
VSGAFESVSVDSFEPGAVPLPRYGSAALADLIPSVLASLGTPGFVDVLGLVPAQAACVLLVDGMGSELIRAYPNDAPVLCEGLAASGRDLTAGFPSTTAASIASIGTGLPPGLHGIVGYQVAVPETGKLMNSLRWDPAVDPQVWQPKPTAFERAAAAGVEVQQVGKRMFKGGGLDRAVLRGARFVGADTFGEIAAGALAGLRTALEARQPGLIYAYVADLDWTGHGHGVGSQAWRLQLQLVDRLVEQFATLLPAGVQFYVTADHGMIDIPVHRRIDVDLDDDLKSGLAVLGGEARARYLYVRDGALDDVLATWRERFGADAVVCTRDEAIDAGWFGDVADYVRPRIGDVVVASMTDLAMVATHHQPNEGKMVGHHGSLTLAEQLVPLAIYGRS